MIGGRSITELQDDPVHKRRLLAYSHDYGVAALWRRARIAGSAMLAAATFVFAVGETGNPPVLGAVAALYLVLARTALTAAEARARRRAAQVQERYDTGLFGLRWNDAVAGDRPSLEDMERSAEKIRRSRRYRKAPERYDRWYDVDLDGLPWPADVLMCQRQSAVWARSDHRAYSDVLWTAFAALLVACLVVGAAKNMRLTSWLVLFLPIAPAALDLADTARAHRRHAAVRAAAEADIAKVWSDHAAAPHQIPPTENRRLQDTAYLHRRDAAPVPNWFYRLRRAQTAIVTAAATYALRRGDHDAAPDDTP